MPACNNKPCTVTEYYFNSYEIATSTPTDGGPRLDNSDAETALEASESWRGRVGGVGYDATRGTEHPLPSGTARYWRITDYETCDDGCRCNRNAAATRTIQQGLMEQQFEFAGVPHGGKNYTITIKASCVLWDFAGRCRPKVVKAALSIKPKHEYFAMIVEGPKPTNKLKPAKSGKKRG